MERNVFKIVIAINIDKIIHVHIHLYNTTKKIWLSRHGV